MNANDLFDLSGRVAVITGGAGMLGLQHAAAIAEAGGRVVLADVSDETERLAVGLSEAHDVDALGVQVDITSKDDVEAMAAHVVKVFGRIDILINNAAMTVKGGGARAEDYFAPFEDYPLDLWDEALRVNLTGAFLCCQSVGRVMVAQRSGVILNIASDVGTISPDHRIYAGAVSPHTGRAFNTPIAYATSKAGLINFTRYLATYWATAGIRVNCLSPGGVNTGHDPRFVESVASRIPLARMAHKDEYKGAVLFLVSDASSYMTGANLIVDGGRTGLVSLVNPARLFRSIALHFLVLAALTGVWMAVIAWNWHRVEALCGPGPDIEARCEHALMGSDATGAGEIFQDFPRSVTELRQARSAAIFVDTPKHPAYGPVSAAANVVASQVFRLHYPATMYFVSALYASACSLLLYRLLCMVGAVWPTSLMLTAVATLSSAWVSVFSLPETYAFSVLALIVTLCSGVALRNARADRRGYLLVIHLLVTGLASWAYLPIAGAVCLVLESVTSVRAWRQMILCSAIVVCVALVPQIRLGGVRQVGEQLAYASAWGSVQNLMSVPTWRDVGSAMSLFSVIFPGVDPLISSGSIDWAAVLSLRSTFVSAIVLASIYVGFAGVVLWECRRNAYISVTLLWMALMVVFHVYFNPREVLLYVSVPVTLVVFMAGTLQAGHSRLASSILAIVLAVETVSWVSFAWRLMSAA